MPFLKVFQTFYCIIKKGCFKGTWLSKPLQEINYGEWIIKKDGIVVMTECFLEGLDSFNIKEQLICGIGKLK
jgi:hypothetical protein